MSKGMMDAALHVTGKSLYLDDTADPNDCLYCAVLFSPAAKGKIKGLNTSSAARVNGVVAVLTADSIPGENQIGNIVQDEPLLAQKEVHFIGQPVAAVYAETESAARKAVKKIKCSIREETPVTDPREAYRNGSLFAPVRTFQTGDSAEALQNCKYVVSGTVESGGQEHFYLEGQGALSVPKEGGGIIVYSSTQAPTTVQKIVARCCALSMNQVEIDVRRLGGGFGGKEDQANGWAALCGVGTIVTGRPVKLLLRRSEDMAFTGKRHPYTSDFTIGLDEDGRIIAYEVFYYQNAGAAVDLSLAVLERSMFHATGSYYIPNVTIKAASCKTNLPPFTAFRGFGGPQAMFVLECALFKAAAVMNRPVHELQMVNLLSDGVDFPYGMKVEGCKAMDCWMKAEDLYGSMMVFSEVGKFNRSQNRYRKGFSIMPVCFGISFTSILLNQARALVHVYQDGSVGISTGAVEMGQGVNQKIRDIACSILQCGGTRIKIESTNTTRVSNTSPTAASTGSDLNGKAAEIACTEILDRILSYFEGKLGTDKTLLSFHDGTLYAGENPLGVTWSDAVLECYLNRIHLSSEAHYATPDIHFDREKEKGTPFSYHVYGTSYTEVTVDRLLGTYTVDAVKIVHDGGKSINRIVDLGQVEGGVAQGIGWMTLEDLRYDHKGRNLSGTAGTYKVPDLHSSPSEILVHFLENNENPHGVMNSKAVGEPPFMYGIGVYFALLNAVFTGKEDAIKETDFFRAPLTPEQVFNLL